MPIHPTFIHLRMHSEYSVVDGIVRLDEVVAKAAAEEMPALALTDLCNLFGLVKFYQAARNKGIKPIVGCDVWISNEADRDKPSRMLLLCQSHPGYLLLCRFLSRAYRENYYRGRAEIRKSWLKESDIGTDGLIALFGRKSRGDWSCADTERSEQADLLATEWAGLFPGRFYIEIQRAGTRIRRLSCTLTGAGLSPAFAGSCNAARTVPESRRLSRARGKGMHCGRLCAG